MNTIATIHPAEVITMTSLELVDYVNAERKENALAAAAGFPSKGFAKLEHYDFMKKAPEVLGGGVGKISDTHVNPQNGQSYPIYRFPKREACLMAMSYSYELQAKVFDRMTELEEQAAKPAFNPASLTRIDILKLAMDSEEGRLKAVAEIAVKDAQLAIAAPKAQALDRISTFAEGSMCITNAAKVLQLQPKKFFAWLQEKQWIYRRAGGSGWVGYQSRIQVGYLEHKITTVERTDGTTKQVEQVLVTAKGLAKLATDFGLLELSPA